MTFGWSGALGAWWLWGASSARSTIAEMSAGIGWGSVPRAPSGPDHEYGLQEMYQL